MNYLLVPLAGLPVHAALFPDGMLGFVQVGGFSGIIEQRSDNKPTATFYPDEIIFKKGNEIQRYAYQMMYFVRNEPLMLEWLKALSQQ